MSNNEHKASLAALAVTTAIGSGAIGYTASHIVLDEQEGCKPFIEQAREQERQNMQIKALQEANELIKNN